MDDITKIKEYAKDSKPSKNKTKKIAVFGILAVMAVMALASYTVIDQTINVNVPEPFDVYYGIAGEPNGYVNCAAVDAAGAWALATAGTPIDAGEFYPGEDRRICILVANAAENSLPYAATISAAAIFNTDNHCTAETVPGNGTDMCYIDVDVADDAAPGAYSPSISLLRG